MGAGGVIADVALAAIEKETPVIVKAMAPEVQAMLAKLQRGTVKVVPPDIAAQVAVAFLLQLALPVFTADVFKTVCEKIGIEVALYDSEFREGRRVVGLDDDAAYVDIRARALVAIEAEGIEITRLKRNLIRQMVSTGIAMYQAGDGAKALTVGKA